MNPKQTLPRYVRRDFEFEKVLPQEWLLVNGIGGYASSTILGLNTRKYHGLLASSDEKLNRTVVLQKLEEEVSVDGLVVPLSVNEYQDGTIHPRGDGLLKELSASSEEVSFNYASTQFKVVKTVRLTPLKNAVVVSYEVHNKTDGRLSFAVIPLGNVRGYHTLGAGDVRASVLDEKTIQVAAAGRKVVVHADNAQASNPPYDLNKGVLYRLERERGEAAVEDVACWGKFEVDVAPRQKTSVSIACADESHPGDAGYSVLSTRPHAHNRTLNNHLEDACNSFIVYTPPWKTVVAGYHWFSEWARDALISLPGLTLVWDNREDAESILRRFFYLFRGGRLPTNTEDGEHSAYDFDGALWLIDRTNQYLKYAGPSAGKKLITENHRVLSEIMQSYTPLVSEGVVQHHSGTWMDTLSRDNAVEIQALYYNALKVYQNLSESYGIKTPKSIDIPDIISSLQENFAKTYWTGKFLKDTTQPWETSVRPNQLIVSSLDYSMLTRSQMASILSACEKTLLTDVGLRTLEPSDARYRGRYAGDFQERESAYHNGTVWPWLLGPYVKTYVRVHGEGSRKKMRKLLEGFFSKTLQEAGVGCISEVFDGDAPHTPRGCIAQAWSIAEPVRAYFEDALGIKPPHEKEVV